VRVAYSVKPSQLEPRQECVTISATRSGWRCRRTSKWRCGSYTDGLSLGGHGGGGSLTVRHRRMGRLPVHLVLGLHHKADQSKGVLALAFAETLAAMGEVVREVEPMVAAPPPDHPLHESAQGRAAGCKGTHDRSPRGCRIDPNPHPRPQATTTPELPPAASVEDRFGPLLRARSSTAIRRAKLRTSRADAQLPAPTLLHHSATV
jgi:hypothetical protein